MGETYRMIYIDNPNTNVVKVGINENNDLKIWTKDKQVLDRHWKTQEDAMNMIEYFKNGYTINENIKDF